MDGQTNGMAHHRIDGQFNGEMQLDDANRLSVRAAEAVHDHRQAHVRGNERRQRAIPPPPSQQQYTDHGYNRPPNINLQSVDPAMMLQPASPVLSPKTPTPEHYQMQQKALYSPSSPMYYPSSPKTPESPVTPVTPVAMKSPSSADQFSRVSVVLEMFSVSFT